MEQETESSCPAALESGKLIIRARQTNGAGRNAIESRGADWLETDARDTSRSAVWSFCDALASGKDPFSGGAPQLVGIWRKGPAQNFGIIWQGRRYLAGLEVSQENSLNNLQWFNELFER